MLEPVSMTYHICECYAKDLQFVVDPALWSKVDGYRRSRNLAGLTSCSCHFDSALHSIKDWIFLRQVEAFFKKNACLANKEVCSEAARLSFMNAESQCSDTNLRLKAYVGRPYLLDGAFHDYVQRMVRYIENVLGDFQLFQDELPNLVKVTSGATSHSARRNSLPQLKMRMRLYATRRIARRLEDLYHWFGFRSPRIKAVHANRVELVPKSWKTDRTIACEPEGNLPFQLAFDTYAKRRLRRYGINLSDQLSNRLAAKEASIDGKKVTVDFSSASDTVSFNTVSLLFPVEWFAYLCECRSPGYRGVFGEGVYSKFSSMGNGSTFVIETLIFAAACYAVGSKGFLVYGDDVIIEKEYFEEFCRLTSFLGFTVNKEKTFHDGPFRESCGGDFFNGINVTPEYVRSIDSRKANLCHLVNTLLGIACPNGALMEFLNNLIVECKLPYVPYQTSTISGVWIDPEKARARKILTRRWSACSSGWYYDARGTGQVDSFKSYVAKTRKRSFVDSRGYYLWFLNKNSQVLFGSPWHVADVSDNRWDQTSSAPVYEHKYVRKRVCWIKPTDGLPFHLYWWKEPDTPA